MGAWPLFRTALDSPAKILAPFITPPQARMHALLQVTSKRRSNALM